MNKSSGMQSAVSNKRCIVMFFSLLFTAYRLPLVTRGVIQ